MNKFSFLLIVWSFCNGQVLLKEDFQNLENWSPLTFPKIDRHTDYSIERLGTGSFLKANTSNSASGLVYRQTFSVYNYPVVRWRWKVSNVFTNGNAKTKSGDDYPLRIYVIFEYDSEKAGFFESMVYESAKLIYGEYPPHSSINYIWANRKFTEKIIANSYTAKARMVLVEQGKDNVGNWVEEEVNVLEDYRIAFGKDPPLIASLAIMSDSDNTGEQAVAYIDYIEVSK